MTGGPTPSAAEPFRRSSSALARILAAARGGPTQGGGGIGSGCNSGAALSLVLPASAFAHTAASSMTESPTVLSQSHPGALDLASMMISGGPVPVAVKKERTPVVVSPPSPMPTVPLAALKVESATVRPSKPAAVIQKDSASFHSSRMPLRVGYAAAGKSDRSEGDAEAVGSRKNIAAAAAALHDIIAAHEDADSPCAGSGVQAVAMLSARGPRRQPAKRSAATPTHSGISGNETQTATTATEGRRSRSMVADGAAPRSGSEGGSRGAATGNGGSSALHRSQSLHQNRASERAAVISPPPVASSARRATQSGQLSASYSAASITALSGGAAPRTATSSSVAPSAAVGVPQVKKFAVQSNVYHSTFVQSMMMSRGPEWKAAFRSVEKLSATEIAQCEFVWFKYEFIKSMPHIDRLRLPTAAIAQLWQRTRELRDMWNEGRPWPTHDDPMRKALDLLNAYIMPEEPETPVSSGPLVNIARKRMPNMALCQSSHAHVVGPLPSGTPPEVQAAFVALKPLLHYHFMKYTKGTPIVACFKEASGVWRKHLLYRHMKQWCDNRPEERGSVRERCPASFEYDLNSSTAAEEAGTFMRTLMAEAGVVRWLAKSTGGANGNGFYVTKDPDDMVRYVSSQPRKAGGESDFWIIQEFVERMPLLFDGHRFHMKVHVVMIGTPVGVDVYAYKRQRIQCCSEVFDPDVMHPLSYIGNWGQQRFATNLVQEKFSTLLEDIKGEYPKLLPAWHRAKQLISEAIEAAWTCGRQFFQFEPGCYELMGWDFVMEECSDGEWRPLLVEANHRPGFGSERKYMEKLIHEVLELVMYPINGLTKYQKETHNGVVEAIWDHVKTIVIHPTVADATATAATAAVDAPPPTTSALSS